MSKKIKAEKSSGNLFADLQIPDAEEALAKADLAYQIAIVIEKKKLSQSAAAKLLGIDQPKVSALLRGKLTGFSTDRLILFLNALGREVEIVVKASRRAHAGVRVIAA